MSQTFQVHVTLKIPDAVARTAENSMRRRMGLSDLGKLSRAEWWVVEFADDCSDAEARLVSLVEKTSLFLNPNKHRYTIHSGKTPSVDAGVCVILVEDKEDLAGRASEEAIRRHPLAGGQVERVHRGTLWMVASESGAPADSRRLAEAVATSTDRTHGLLANPHYQNVTLLGAS